MPSLDSAAVPALRTNSRRSDVAFLLDIKSGATRSFGLLVVLCGANRREGTFDPRRSGTLFWDGPVIAVDSAHRRTRSEPKESPPNRQAGLTVRP